MAEPALKKMTVDEFFVWQRRQDRNYELVDGVPILAAKAMTGASDRHDAITVNAIAVFHRKLRGGPCKPRTQDRSVRTTYGTRRPDVLIDCGKPDPRSMEAAEPRVVLEVLSPSTMRFDHFQKVEEYKLHPSIRVILLIDTENPRVTVWRREGKRWASIEKNGMDASIALPEVSIDLLFAELYEGLDFPALEIPL